MFQTFDQAQVYVAERGVRMIDLKFCDLWGRWHHLTIPARQFNDALMREGVGFDGSAVGLKSVKAGEVFSEELLAQWIAFKREAEYYPVRNRPHPFEMQLYFDV